jgi:hypothetical protein
MLTPEGGTTVGKLIELKFCDICRKPVVKRELAAASGGFLDSTLCKECQTKYGHLYRPW